MKSSVPQNCRDGNFEVTYTHKYVENTHRNKHILKSKGQHSALLKDRIVMSTSMRYMEAVFTHAHQEGDDIRRVKQSIHFILEQFVLKLWKNLGFAL